MFKHNTRAKSYIKKFLGLGTVLALAGLAVLFPTQTNTANAHHDITTASFCTDLHHVQRTGGDMNRLFGTFGDGSTGFALVFDGTCRDIAGLAMGSTSKDGYIVASDVVDPTNGCNDGDDLPTCLTKAGTHYIRLYYISDTEWSFDPPPTDIPGCTYPEADNYDASATVDDGSCVFPTITPPTTAEEYYESATKAFYQDNLYKTVTVFLIGFFGILFYFMIKWKK